MSTNNSSHRVWSSKIAFILAATGSAVGLGNIWRFPYLVGRYGGGTFITMYLIFAIMIGGTVLLAEIILGRYIKDPFFSGLAEKIPNKTLQSSILFVFIFAPIAILSMYFVVAGWSLYYFFASVFGNISYTNIIDYNYYNDVFANFTQAPWLLFIFTMIFVIITLAINYKGVIKGVEKVNLFLLPLLFIALILIVIRILTLPGAVEGMSLIFKFDTSMLTADLVKDALAQASFSLSIGVGVMLAYGSLVDSKNNTIKSTSYIIILGSSVGIFSSLIVIPATYIFGFNLDQGPSLSFITLPAIFSQIPFGVFFASVLFLAMAFAALTSTVSLIEALLSGLREKFPNRPRKCLFGIMILIFLVLSTLNLMAFNVLDNVLIFGYNIFDFTSDVIVNNLFILGTLFSSLLVGWYVDKKVLYNELTNNDKNKQYKVLFPIWLFLLRYIVPAVMVITFINPLIS